MDVYVLKNLIGPEIYGVYKDEAAAEKAQSKLEIENYNNHVKGVVLKIEELTNIDGVTDIKDDVREIYLLRGVKFYIVYNIFSKEDKDKAIHQKELINKYGLLRDELEVVGPFKIKENV